MVKLQLSNRSKVCEGYKIRERLAVKRSYGIDPWTLVQSISSKKCLDNARDFSSCGNFEIGIQWDFGTESCVLPGAWELAARESGEAPALKQLQGLHMTRDKGEAAITEKDSITFRTLVQHSLYLMLGIPMLRGV